MPALRPRAHLTIQQLDDRILPSSVPSLLAPPVYWTESKFFPTAIAAGENGSTWVVGTTQAAGAYGWWGPWSNDWGIVKLDANGQIDSTFNNGKVKDLNAGLLDWFRVLQVQTGSDGKVYVLARNTAHDGIPVDTMPTVTNVAGFQSLPPSPPAAGVPASPPSGPPTPLPTAADLTILPHPYPLPNPIAAPNENYAIVRFNADGTLDTTFNKDGIALFDLDPNASQAYGWSQDAEFDLNDAGQIIVAAVRNNFYPPIHSTVVDVMRLTANGQADGSFDVDGRAALTLPWNPAETSLYLQVLGVNLANDGSVTIGGSYSVWTSVTSGPNVSQNSSGLYIAKVTADGAANTSYSGDGIAILDQAVLQAPNGLNSTDFVVSSQGDYFTGSIYPTPVVIPDPPGNFLYPPSQGYIARIAADGTLDNSFDGDGILLPQYDSQITVTGGSRLLVQENGDLLVAMQEQQQTAPGTVMTNFVIARHHADGSLDNTFSVVRETPANYGWISDLTMTTNGVYRAVRGYPNTLLAIDSDGVPATTVTIPYDRIAPWSPPDGWQPFPFLPSPVSYRETQADVNADGVDDRIYVSGVGARSSIRVVDGRTGNDLVSDFQPYEDRFQGGMFVDVGDFDGDGKAEIVVSPDEGGSARIQVFTYDATGLRQRANFFAIEDPNFRGGGSIGVIDLNEDGTPDVVVGAARGGSQRIANFDGKDLFNRNSNMPLKLFGDYFAPLSGVNPADYRGGVQIVKSDTNGDGIDELTFQANGTGSKTVLSTRPNNGYLFNLQTPAGSTSLTFNAMSGIFVGGSII